MTSLKERIARQFMITKAARMIKEELDVIGIDILKKLANNGQSIIEEYLSVCSPEERKAGQLSLKALLQMGVTIDMILDEVTRIIPELKPIIEGKPDYKKAEIQNLEKFLRDN